MVTSLIVISLMIICTNCYNLFCDESLPWYTYQDGEKNYTSNLYNIDNCSFQWMPGVQPVARILLNVTTIFSNPDNYPLNVTMKLRPQKSWISAAIQFAVKDHDKYFYPFGTNVTGLLKIIYTWPCWNCSRYTRSFHRYTEGQGGFEFGDESWILSGNYSANRYIQELGYCRICHQIMYSFCLFYFHDQTFCNMRCLILLE